MKKLIAISIIFLTVFASNKFYDSTWQAAWDASHPDSVKTKIIMWDYFFAPHPFNSRYHEIMLELESQVDALMLEKEYCIVEWDKALNRNRRIGVICGAVGAVLSSITTVLICNNR